MFDDIFGDILDDITNKPQAPPEPAKDEWDTGAGNAWDSGQRENLWRTGNQFWDTGNRRPDFGPASNNVPDPGVDPDYNPEPDDEFFDEEDDDFDSPEPW